jgi:hypothetical protein
MEAVLLETSISSRNRIQVVPLSSLDYLYKTHKNSHNSATSPIFPASSHMWATDRKMHEDRTIGTPEVSCCVPETSWQTKANTGTNECDSSAASIFSFLERARSHPFRNSLRGFPKPNSPPAGHGTSATSVNSGPASEQDADANLPKRRVSFSKSVPEIHSVYSKRQYARAAKERHYSSYELRCIQAELENLEDELFPHHAITRRPTSAELVRKASSESVGSHGKKKKSSLSPVTWVTGAMAKAGIRAPVARPSDSPRKTP